MATTDRPTLPPMFAAVACVRSPIDAAAMLAAVGDATAGGNVLFVGTARGVTDGVVTRSLAYDAHEPLAMAALEGLELGHPLLQGPEAFGIAVEGGAVAIKVAGQLLEA